MKIFKILIFNIILFILTVIFAEFFCYHYIWKGERYSDSVFHSVTAENYFSCLYNREDCYYAYNKAFRPDININSNKKPILFMGCSFTYGTGLKDDETISYITAMLTKRPVYNRAGMGFGLNQFLYQIKRGDIYNQMKEPEFLIYIFIWDHVHRMDKFKIEPGSIEFQPKYKIKRNKLVEITPKFYDYLYSVQHYQFYYTYWFNILNLEKVKMYFTEAEKELHKHWPDTKMVILLYPDECTKFKSLWDELQNKNYTVINIQDLIGKDINLNSQEYQVEGDNWHPNKKTWEIVVPLLIKKLDSLSYGS